MAVRAPVAPLSPPRKQTPCRRKPFYLEMIPTGRRVQEPLSPNLPMSDDLRDR